MHNSRGREHINGVENIYYGIDNNNNVDYSSLRGLEFVRLKVPFRHKDLELFLSMDGSSLKLTCRI